MDKTAFSAFRKENEPNDFKFWQSKTVSERLMAAAYLNSIAFNYNMQNPSRMDKTIFSIEKEIYNGT